MRTTTHSFIAALLVVAGVTACQGDADQGGDSGFSPQDSIATAGEISASLQGGTAPGKQSYVYRGLYAGMTRGALEQRMQLSALDTASRCTPGVGKLANELTCQYTAVLGPDSAHLAISATFTNDARGSAAATAATVAREIVVVRQLPIDVDGVQVARGLSDAFAAQTVLLDRREATYGRHSALVRMGTMRGDRENYATVAVEDKHGREQLTVTLARSGPAVKAPAPAPAPAPTAKAPVVPTRKKGKG